MSVECTIVLYNMLSPGDKISFFKKLYEVRTSTENDAKMLVSILRPEDKKTLYNALFDDMENTTKNNKSDEKTSGETKKTMPIESQNSAVNDGINWFKNLFTTFVATPCNTLETSEDTKKDLEKQDSETMILSAMELHGTMASVNDVWNNWTPYPRTESSTNELDSMFPSDMLLQTNYKHSMSLIRSHDDIMKTAKENYKIGCEKLDKMHGLEKHDGSDTMPIYAKKHKMMEEIETISKLSKEQIPCDKLNSVFDEYKKTLKKDETANTVNTSYDHNDLSYSDILHDSTFCQYLYATGEFSGTNNFGTKNANDNLDFTITAEKVESLSESEYTKGHNEITEDYRNDLMKAFNEREVQYRVIYTRSESGSAKSGREVKHIIPDMSKSIKKVKHTIPDIFTKNITQPVNLKSRVKAR